MMNGIKNILVFLNENWTTILVCCGIIAGIIKKTIDWFSKTQDEKVAIAKVQIEQTILKLISTAEIDWGSWNKAGSIKRSQVINQIYEQYPILSKVANQEEIITWIDKEIDSSLKTLRDIVKNQTTE